MHFFTLFFNLPQPIIVIRIFLALNIQFFLIISLQLCQDLLLLLNMLLDDLLQFWHIDVVSLQELAQLCLGPALFLGEEEAGGVCLWLLVRQRLLLQLAAAMLLKGSWGVHDVVPCLFYDVYPLAAAIVESKLEVIVLSGQFDYLTNHLLLFLFIGHGLFAVVIPLCPQALYLCIQYLQNTMHHLSIIDIQPHPVQNTINVLRPVAEQPHCSLNTETIPTIHHKNYYQDQYILYLQYLKCS